MLCIVRAFIQNTAPIVELTLASRFHLQRKIRVHGTFISLCISGLHACLEEVELLQKADGEGVTKGRKGNIVYFLSGNTVKKGRCSEFRLEDR